MFEEIEYYWKHETWKTKICDFAVALGLALLFAIVVILIGAGLNPAYDVH